MADYRCSNCGREYDWYDGSIIKEKGSKRKLCSACNEPLVLIETGEIVGGQKSEDSIIKTVSDFSLQRKSPKSLSDLGNNLVFTMSKLRESEYSDYNLEVNLPSKQDSDKSRSSSMIGAISKGFIGVGWTSNQKGLIRLNKNPLFCFVLETHKKYWKDTTQIIIAMETEKKEQEIIEIKPEKKNSLFKTECVGVKIRGNSDAIKNIVSDDGLKTNLMRLYQSAIPLTNETETISINKVNQEGLYTYQIKTSIRNNTEISDLEILLSSIYQVLKYLDTNNIVLKK